MAEISELMFMLGTGGQIGGSLYKGYAANQAGKYNAGLALQEGEFLAKHLERAANEERVAGQRAAFEQQHKTNQVMSTIRANAAASGAGGIDTPTVLDIMGDTIARGEYLEDVELYGAESRARGREDQASAARAKGKNSAEMFKVQGKNAMTGSILESIGIGGKAYFDYDKTYGTTKKKAGAAYDPSWSNTTVRYG